MCLPTSTVLPTETPLSRGVPDCVPLDTLSKAAYQYASQQLHPTILSHSIRVFLYARALASRQNSSYDRPDRLPLLFVACILHDIGTTAAHDGPQRFEVEGADAAVAIIRRSGSNVPEHDAHDVWVAIAIHTSPGIAERIGALARLVRLGVAIDFKRFAGGSYELELSAEVEEAERVFARGEIEKVLGDSVAEQALRRPEKAPAASWPGILLRSARENPGWEGVNKAF